MVTSTSGGVTELFDKIHCFSCLLSSDRMKRLNTRDISSFFTKKTNKENGPPSQASEPPASPQESEPLAPEIEILPPPLTSEQNSS